MPHSIAMNMETSNSDKSDESNPQRTKVSMKLGPFLFLLCLSNQCEAFTSTPRTLPGYTRISTLNRDIQQQQYQLNKYKSDTSLNILFRKSSGDSTLKKTREDKSKNRQKGKLKSSGFFSSVMRPFRKKTEIQSTLVDTSLIERPKRTSSEQERKSSCRIIENQFHGFFERRSIHSLNLQVHADPQTNSLTRLARGKLGRVRVSFDRLAFPRIKMSGGGQFRLPKDASFAVLSIPSSIQKSFNIKRFTSNFELEANNVIFTQDDIKDSFWIRRGLELLLNRILKSVVVRTMGGVAVVRSSVETVEILDDGKISCRGEARAQNGTAIPFEVITGLRTSSSGRILHFPGIEMHFFPIEMIPFHHSILRIPLYKFFPVDVDIGKNANLEVRVDGRRKRLEVSLWSLVTPHKLDRDRVKASDFDDGSRTKNARFYCDVGRWVTKIGRFAE